VTGNGLSSQLSLYTETRSCSYTFQGGFCMVKFAHIADCHLGSWRTEELQNLNFLSFETAINHCIDSRVDFILIAGDLFDSAYPPIEVLKKSFEVFKKIHDANIPVYLVAGSHDFSASGKTFLDVLEKAGFAKNVEKTVIQEDGKIKLIPTMHKEIAIFGYPGRKSGMEVGDLKKVFFDKPNGLTVFMLHTTIQDVVGSVPIEYVRKETLPLADYYAFGHIHKRFCEHTTSGVFSYPGPTFPCNFQELSDLTCGSYNLVTVEGSKIKVQNILIPLREVVSLTISLENGLTATQEIIRQVDKANLRGKILLLKLQGTLKTGKTGDIKFNEIEDFINKKGASVCLRHISSLKVFENEYVSEQNTEGDMDYIEKQIMHTYSRDNPGDYNKYLPQLMNVLSLEKNEDEKASVFEDRLLSDLKETLEISEALP